MSDKGRAAPRRTDVNAPGEFAHRVILWWLPLLYLLISSLFYLRTYDSAQVKITVLQMGGLALLTLWGVRLLEAGKSAFSKDDLVTLSPFLAYLLVGILSYLHAPYHMASTDFFLRHVFFMIAALVLIYEFDLAAIDRLTRVLIWTAWIAVGYGFLQFVDMRLFPPGIGNGLDPFIWRGAFGQRVFSTYGNPNFFADFLVISFPILLTQYLKDRRRFSLLVLMALSLVDLYATGTKGAWLGFVVVVLLFGAVAFAFFKEAVAPYKKWLLSVVAGGALVFIGFTAQDLRTRIVSVNFRLFTWEATWEMIMTHPLIGTGIGSFPPIYPAFRRPPIFHIEGKHNTETDHAEDEYLEELFDNGILGFGVFLWLIFSTLEIGFRSLGQLTTTLRLKDGRAPPRAFDLVGYIVAFAGMLGHNFFDVSMRFVSSGVYLGLLSGTIVSLARGHGLFELHAQGEARDSGGLALAQAGGSRGAWRTLSELLIWPARLAAWLGLGYIIFAMPWSPLERSSFPSAALNSFGGILGQFAVLQGPLDRLVFGGEILQWWLAWIVLAACVLILGWCIAKLVFLSENPLVPLLVLAAVYPMKLFWGFFKADIHHNMAIAYSKQRRWDDAVLNYRVVHQLNRDYVMALYFLGNVFNDRFDMNKTYNPAWGDTDNAPRDDYERALDAYNEVRRLAPNYVQMHYQVGQLHFRRAEWAIAHGQPQQAEKFFKRALNRFRLYEEIDPVFAPNWYLMARIYMIHKDWASAAKMYEDYMGADKCAVAPSLISKKWLRETILAYQSYVNEPGIPYPVHRHTMTSQAYTNLGNCYFMLNRLRKAEEAYREALREDPND
ncbi:MAG: tetratricopeptide repeat protein, partial [Elusimicrobia bacterium]|nr:tetratricopeptide repeat protein [Elusimicrobiota bacterium]